MSSTLPATVRSSPLRRTIGACHAILVAAVAVAVYSAGLTMPWRELGALASVAPLLATAAGVVRAQRSVERWLSLLLVLYAGAASVEVVASAGAAHAASIALLAAVAELGLLLALIRRSPSRAQADRA